MMYESLARLGPGATRALLRIYNARWAEEYLPDFLKITEIIPLLKPRNPPKVIDFFRNVCLTSCVENVLEKIMRYRLHVSKETKYSSIKYLLFAQVAEPCCLFLQHLAASRFSRGARTS